MTKGIDVFGLMSVLCVVMQAPSELIFGATSATSGRVNFLSAA